MPKGTDRRDKNPGPAAYLWAALVAILAGFVTVYLTLGLWRNGGGEESVKAERTEQAPQARRGAGPLAGLNRGAMAAFLIKQDRVELPDVGFEDGDGGEKRLKDWRGKVVLLNIWATWCAPCREEMPALERLQAELGGKDFEVVAVSIDRGGPEKAKSFLRAIGVENLAFYIDPSGKLFAQLKAVGMPITLLIDAEGREMGRLVGPADWDAPEAVALIEAAIKEAEGSSQVERPGGAS